MAGRRFFAFFVVLVAALLLRPPAALAQAIPHPAPAAPAPAPDEEAADSPRASVRTFLDLCDHGRYDDAARYLDIPRGSEKRGAELAKKLEAVLDARLWVDPERLSARSQGSPNDGLPAGTEELGKIPDAKGHAVAIRLVRHEARTPEDEARWVFSQTTVQAIDGLYANLSAQWIRDHVPRALLAEGPLALYWWQWLALPILIGLSVLAGRFLAWISALAGHRLLGRWPWTSRVVPRVQRPISAGFALALFWLVLPQLALTLKAEELVERILRALGYLAFFWGLLRVVSVAGDEIAETPWAQAKPSVRSLSSVLVRLGKVIVAAIALMVVFTELGYPVTTVIAGLGIGGVAVALAAQKTLENLFGSIAILVDQPFQVGETIRVDTVEGTVESIGLRSTRFRTVDRTLIIIPNGKLADMRIESLGPRDRIRFATKLQIARDASATQLTIVASAIRAVLLAHAKVKKDDVHVRFSGFGEHSFDLEVAAPIETVDAVEFAKVREELLLDCVAAIEKAGLRLAVPARSIAIMGATDARAKA